MKKSLIITLLLVSASIFGQSDTVSFNEKDMVKEINNLRTNPKSYIRYIEKFINDEKIVNDINNEDVSYANILIKALIKTKPMSKVVQCDYMSDITKTHLKCLNNERKVCKECASDGKLVDRFKHLKISYINENIVPNIGAIESIVFLLFTDSDAIGIILDPDWKFVSIASDDELIIQDFAY